MLSRTAIPRRLLRIPTQKRRNLGHSLPLSAELQKSYTNANATRKPKPKLKYQDRQKSFNLAKNVQKLCDMERIKEAAELVLQSPLAFQTPPVWGTLIKEASKAQKLSFAYSIFTEMRSRGHRPTFRTYYTLQQGLAKSTEPLTELQLQRAEKIFVDYSDFARSKYIKDPSDPEVSQLVGDAYLTILTKANKMDEALDAWRRMSLVAPGSPLDPGPSTYVIMLRAIGSRTALHFGSTAPESARRDVEIRNAIDAKFILEKAGRPSLGKEVIDASVIAAALEVLIKGTKKHVDYAFDVVAIYTGISRYDIVQAKHHVRMSEALLAAVLKVAIALDEHSMPARPFSIDIMDRFMTTAPYNRKITREVAVLYLRHLHTIQSDLAARTGVDLLRWLIDQPVNETRPSSIDLRPDDKIFGLVLGLCVKVQDWYSAISTICLMTGFSQEHLEAIGVSCESVDRWSGKPLQRPDAGHVAALFKVALARGDVTMCATAARTLQNIGFPAIFPQLLDSPERIDSVVSETASDSSKPTQKTRSGAQEPSSADDQLGQELELVRLLGDALRLLKRTQPPVEALQTRGFSPDEITLWNNDLQTLQEKLKLRGKRSRSRAVKLSSPPTQSGKLEVRDMREYRAAQQKMMPAQEPGLFIPLVR